MIHSRNFVVVFIYIFIPYIFVYITFYILDFTCTVCYRFLTPFQNYFFMIKLFLKVKGFVKLLRRENFCSKNKEIIMTTGKTYDRDVKEVVTLLTVIMT